MKNLRAVRQSRSYTQLQLAKKSGLSQSYINELENQKKTNPSITVLKKLSHALDINLLEFIKNEAGEV